MARVLIISHAIPYAPGPGSATREYSLAKELAQTHEITYLLPNYEDQLHAKKELLSRFCHVRLYYPLQPQSSLLYRLNWSLQRRVPVEATIRQLIGPPLLVQELQAILSGLQSELAQINWQEFDIVQVAHSHMSAIIRRFPIPLPIIVDWHNIYTEYYRRKANHSTNQRERIAFRFEQHRMESHERWVLEHTHHNTTVSTVDAAHLKGLWPKARTTVVPNGVDCEYFSNPRPEICAENRLVFTGTMDYEPNIEAVFFVVNMILPIIWQDRSDVQLYIVGKDPTVAIRALANRFPGRIIVTGAVDDIRPFLRQATVAIVPLLNGSGTRLKILEAMAMQKAVVSTSVGAEGLDVAHGRDIIIADSPASFAEAVLFLLQDSDSRRRIAAQANITVQQRYDWKRISTILNQVWEEVVRENGR